MRIKVGDEYLDFNGSITVDKQSFIFEEIDDYQGDRSYGFSLPITTKNLTILGIQSIDTLSKPIYNQIQCLLEDDLNVIYQGYIKVERIEKFIEVSFVTGNYEWINAIDSKIKDLDLSSYDIDITRSNIISTVGATSGIVFPLVDRGALGTRASNRLYIDDFQPFIFVKNVIDKIFETHQIKITGELLNDPTYNSLTISSQSTEVTEEIQEMIDDRTCYVGITSPLSPVISDDITMVDNTGDFFDGAANLWDNVGSMYTADRHMIVEVEVLSETDLTGSYEISIVSNGEINLIADGEPSGSKLCRFQLMPGSTIAFVYSKVSGDPALIMCTARITPIKIYRTAANTLCGSMSSIQLIKNVFNAFNVVPVYDVVQKTLTANLFKNIRSKSEVDISQYVTSHTIDFEEFISSYGKRSWLKYSSGSESTISEYNENNTAEYGSDYLEVNNDFIPNDEDVIELDFISVRTGYIQCLDAYLPKLTFCEAEQQESTSIESFGSSGTEAVVFVDQKDWFGADGLQRIDGYNVYYSKDWHVDVVAIPTTGYTLKDSIRIGSTTGSVSRLLITDTPSDDVVIMVYVPSVSVDDFSTLSSFLFYDGYADASPSSVSTIGYCYFVKPQTETDTNFTQSLAFGLPNEFTQYQMTMKETYYRDFTRVLNDPVKVKALANLPYNVFQNITPLSPIRLKTEKFNSLFYLNKISGYKGVKYPCLLELIKL